MKGERKYKICRVMGFFILIYSLLTIMVTNSAFRKSSLENLFLKVVFEGTSKHWSYYIGLVVFFVKFRLLSVCQHLY